MSFITSVFTAILSCSLTHKVISLVERDMSMHVIVCKRRLELDFIAKPKFVADTRILLLDQSDTINAHNLIDSSNDILKMV